MGTIYAADGSLRVTTTNGAGTSTATVPGQAVSASSLPVVISSDQTPIPTSTATRIATATVVRPANTTAYAAGQAVGTAGSCLFTFSMSGFLAAGGRGRVISARLAKSTNVVTLSNFRLWLHNSATFTAPAADQAAIAFTNSNRNVRLPFITFPIMISGGACAESIGNVTAVSALGIPFDMAGVETDLVGILEATAAYVPGSGEVFYIELGISVDN